MAKSRDPGVADLPSAPSCQPELGDQLKVMFGEMSSGPLPPRLMELADRLEEAFQRGDLFAGHPRRRAS